MTFSKMVRARVCPSAEGSTVLEVKNQTVGRGGREEEGEERGEEGR